MQWQREKFLPLLGIKHWSSNPQLVMLLAQLFALQVTSIIHINRQAGPESAVR
jgi:hypothetical protein